MLEKVLYAKENQSGRWESHYTHMPNRLAVRREGGGCSSASVFCTFFLRKNFVMGEGVILAASVGEQTQLLFGRPLFCGGHASAGGHATAGARLCGGRLFVLGFCVSGVLCVQKRGF